MWPFQRKPAVKWYSIYYGPYDTEYLDKFASESEFLEGVPEELFYLPRKIYLSDVVEWRKIRDKTGEWPTYTELLYKINKTGRDKNELH